MTGIPFKHIFCIENLKCRKRFMLLLFAILTSALILIKGTDTQSSNNYFTTFKNTGFLTTKSNSENEFSSLSLWEAPNQDQGGPNSFVTINYDKCIPVQQCKFNDCNIEGSYDGNGKYCLPTDYSKIGDWVPDISLNIFGIPIIKNPRVFSAPVEHTQASARLPDKDGNAYFMFSNSQNYFGFIWVVEVQGIDPNQPEHISSSMPAKVVWWQKLNKCNDIKQCINLYNPGNYNHPARISRTDNMLAIAFQNFSFTLKGKLHLSRISKHFDNKKLPIPPQLETSTLPIYPKLRSADAIAFYDVSNPREPKFVKKLIGDQPELWGGYPPGRDISEVSIAKAGEFYHLNIGGTFYNYNGEGSNKMFGIDYRMNLHDNNTSLSPLLGEISAASFTNVTTDQNSYPMKISLNTVPVYHNQNGYVKFALALQLVASKLKYNNAPEYIISERTDTAATHEETVFTSNLLSGELTNSVNTSQSNDSSAINDLEWMAEACNRAWGFQMLENGGYNVICHDIDPRGIEKTSVGRFLVRGVSPEHSSPTIVAKSTL